MLLIKNNDYVNGYIKELCFEQHQRHHLTGDDTGKSDQTCVTAMSGPVVGRLHFTLVGTKSLQNQI